MPDLTDSPIDWVARHIRRYLRSGDQMFNGRPSLLITTRGRRSGILRRTALYYARDGDHYLVVASGGGEPTHPSWYLNLLAHPVAVVQVGAATFGVHARTATPGERPPLWARLTAVFPKYDDYQARTTRELPVVILEPEGDQLPAGMVLAAGAGRRYGMPKALVRLDDQLFVERALGVLRAGGCSPVIVVLGAAAPEVLAAADLGDAVVVHNPDWASGMGSSLRAGLSALSTVDAPAVVVLPVDTPGVTPAAVRRLAGQTGPEVLARATYHGQPGHPVVIGRTHWPGVHDSATGDAGARTYLADHKVVEVPCEDVADGTDVDFPPPPS